MKKLTKQDKERVRELEKEMERTNEYIFDMGNYMYLLEKGMKDSQREYKLLTGKNYEIKN